MLTVDSVEELAKIKNVSKNCQCILKILADDTQICKYGASLSQVEDILKAG
jgi:hypothetical protein